jgi:hypothetical protein
MKKTSAKTASPKKAADLADASQRMLNGVEFTSKELQQDIKGWQEQLRILKESLQKMETDIQSENPINKQELNKLYTNAESISSKTNKEIEKTQSQLHKLQVQFEKTLLIPEADGDFNHLAAEQHNAIKSSINKIKELLVANKQALDEVIDITIQCAKRLKLLESPVTRICLSEQLDVTIDANEKLNKRLQLIHDAAATVFQPPTADSLKANPKQFNFTDTNAKFLQLFEHHQRGAKLLAETEQAFKAAPAELLGSLSIN